VTAGLVLLGIRPIIPIGPLLYHEVIPKRLKMKTLLRISLLVIVALALLAPVVAQDTPGLLINWTIALTPPAVEGGERIAQYIRFSQPSPAPRPTPNPHQYAKFMVQCEYLRLPDMTPLDVYVGPGNAPSNRYGVLVGRMHVMKGTVSLLVTTAKVPTISKGTTVTIVTREGTVIMGGRF
jgi:hypothetical protein